MLRGFRLLWNIFYPWRTLLNNIMAKFSKYRQSEIKGTHVVVQDDRVEQALRKFKKKVQETGLLQELRDRETFTKPTTRRKQARNAAKRRWQKKLQADQLPKKLF